jgi:hypothetical protein
MSHHLIIINAFCQGPEFWTSTVMWVAVQIAAIRRGLFWFGIESNKKMQDNIPRNCVLQLSKTACEDDYFKKWAANPGIYIIIYTYISV